MSDYSLTAEGGIIRVSDGAGIPRDLANEDYKAYLAWVDAGGVPTQEPPTRHEDMILAQLDALDAKSIRPLRALLAGTGTDEDRAKLAAIEAQAQALRVKTAAGKA